MKEYLSTNIRHALTFLAGAFTWLFNKGLLTAEEAQEVTARVEGVSEFIAPLIAVVIVRVIIMLLGKVPLPDFLKSLGNGEKGNVIILSLALMGMALVSGGLLTSCSIASGGGLDVRVTTDGCALVGKTSANGQRYYAGICLDGRYVARWDARQADGSLTEVRYTRFPNGSNSIEYRSDDIWLSWDDKSGVQIGEVPVVPSSSEIEDGKIQDGRADVQVGPPLVSPETGLVPSADEVPELGDK